MLTRELVSHTDHLQHRPLRVRMCALRTNSFHYTALPSYSKLADPVSHGLLSAPSVAHRVLSPAPRVRYEELVIRLESGEPRGYSPVPRYCLEGPTGDASENSTRGTVSGGWASIAFDSTITDRGE